MCTPLKQYLLLLNLWMNTQWEKPDEYSMYERWLKEQTRLQDEKIKSPPLNNESQEAIENSEQVESDVLQQNGELQQPSLSTAVRENFNNDTLGVPFL